MTRGLGPEHDMRWDQMPLNGTISRENILVGQLLSRESPPPNAVATA